MYTITLLSLVLAFFLYRQMVRNISLIEAEMEQLDELSDTLSKTRYDAVKILQSRSMNHQWKIFEESFNSMKRQYEQVSRGSYIPSLSYDLNRSFQRVLMLEKLSDHQFENLQRYYHRYYSFALERIDAAPSFSVYGRIEDYGGDLLFHRVNLSGAVDGFDSILASSASIIETQFAYIQDKVSQISKRAMIVSSLVSFIALGGSALLIMISASRLIRDTQQIIRTLQSVRDDEDSVSFPINRKDEIGMLARELSAVFNKLFSARNRMMQSDRLASLNHLLVGLSHEINTPLGICVTSGSFLESELSSSGEKAVSAVALLNSSIKKIVRLVNSFRELSTAGSNEEVILDLSEHVKRFIENYRNIQWRRTFNIKFHEEDHIKCRINPSHLNEILIQLFDNSLKHGGYHESQPLELVIKLTENDSQYTLSFSDDGIGMTAERLAHIFDPFYTTTRSGGSTGLGLYRIYNLVTNSLKGSINCRSGENEGTRFTLTWPA